MSLASPINAERLWCSLMDMATVGPGADGGSCRLALTDADRDGRQLFMDWAWQAGYTLASDDIGNLFVTRSGEDDSLSPVVMGSHLDTQPTGGRFDGVLGVLAGLEVLRSLDDQGIRTRHPVAVAVWMNEEGSRFSPPMMGSGVWAGVFNRQEILDKVGQDGARLGDELQRLGWDGELPADHHRRPFAACFELHIEQGPVLEDADCQIGVVTGSRAQRWYEVTLTGQEAHAGPTPMRLRRDALVGAARVVELVNRIGNEGSEETCATVGILDVHPHSRNVIPGRVFLTVDVRDPDEALLLNLHRRFHREARDIAGAAGLEIDIHDFWHSPATPFDAALVERVRAGAGRLGYSHRDLVSGAGHDTVYVARVCPSAMIFVPCEGGISHNEAENIQPGDAARGCAVLFEAVVETAGRE